MYFDVIIAGGGAAGCVLASRLSEDTARSILLIESGPDRLPGKEGADIRDAYPVSTYNPLFSWSGLKAQLGIDRGGGRQWPPVPFAQGHGIGGTSNINGMIAYRGVREDYARWSADGGVGWDWDSVLPYFAKLETDHDFSGSGHGKDGPIPIRRIMPEDWSPFSRAVGDAAMRRGWPLVEDCNTDNRDGVHPVPMSNLESGRVSASMAYLTPQVRKRGNLTILTDTRVERVNLRDGRAEGVTARAGATSSTFTARETIVCCGGLYSPALLLRSGIGPTAELCRTGIPVVRDMPGVGKGLQNKPKVEVAVHLPVAMTQPPGQRAVGQNCLRYSSDVSGCSAHDIDLKFVNKSAWHALGRRIGVIVVLLCDPMSRGEVILVDANSETPPIINFRALSDPRDFDRLAGALRLALELLADASVGRVRNEVFLPNARIARSLARRTPWNRFKGRLLAGLLDMSWVRKLALGSATIDLPRLLADEAAIRKIVTDTATTGWHVCATCRMGDPSDPFSVVDHECRVLGIDALRVIDASVFPRALGEGGMHIPVLMIAEKMADTIKREWATATLKRAASAETGPRGLSSVVPDDFHRGAGPAATTAAPPAPGCP